MLKNGVGYSLRSNDIRCCLRVYWVESGDGEVGEGGVCEKRSAVQFSLGRELCVSLSLLRNPPSSSWQNGVLSSDVVCDGVEKAGCALVV